MPQNVWEADKMLDSYIYDYLLKRNLQNTAKAFQTESNVPSAPVAIDAPGGFLFEWWSVFWDIFIARTNEKHSDSAAAYLESIKAWEQQQQSQQQVEIQQSLLQRHVQQQQQHPQEQQHLQLQRCQQKQQQRNENTDFSTSVQNGMAAADPQVRQNATAASDLSAKIYEDRMKITAQRDISDEASLKQRLTGSIGPLLESNPTSRLKSPARSAIASGQIVHRPVGGVSASLQQAQARSQPILGSTQAGTDVASNQRAGADGPLFGVQGSNLVGNNLTLKGWPLTGLEQLRSGFLQHKSYVHSPQPLQHQFQFLTPQQQQILLRAQQNMTSSPIEMDNRRLRMFFSSQNLVPGRDGQSNALTEFIPSAGQSLPNLCLPTQCTETDMLMKKIAALYHHQQQQSNSQQQLLHPLLSQQQQSSTFNANEQEKMGDGSVTVAFHGNQQVSKNKIGRKRKQPFSSSTPANSSGTTNTAGASPSSTPSTPSAYSPGETISMPQVPHNASLSKALVVYGYDPQGSPTNPLVDMDHYVEDGSIEDNVEPTLLHDDIDLRVAGSHCINSAKGYILREMSSAQASTSSVLCCHFSSDGKLLATGGHDKKVFLWNTETLKQKSILEEHSQLITDVRFSPSTPFLATSSFDKTVRVWDTDNVNQGYSIRTFTGHSASVMSLDFHPNKDDLICSCDGDNEIRFWSIKHGNNVRIFKGGSAQLRFQPRYGEYLATTSDNMVSILDVETQACVRRFESHTKDVGSLCWDPTGEYVVSVSEDIVKVWSLNDMSCVNELNCSGRKLTSCAFHPTYPSLLVIGCYQSLELWDMTENRSMTIAAHDSLVSAVASSSSGLVATTGHDKYVKLWR
ncbi:transcriptional corepressor LEUNIG-like isoform X4 [Panicum virgatum]|uniref:transcriptional corepressor LEUNIG-like isoform X4 n=1 Tax=Panicum virgatum TaxID=38727 RepID=UPI0019D5C75B|nr:transcriptional corepressor LEUNIG-like isoform X4 [Panicum virgatum]